ncbi:phosphotransferase [Sulfuricaulis limicola]|uniref:phosphotransferase n=1 Tax=Sulfuricaulis limicola TaxID=1620215 RepID=UPI0015578D12|nr:phosphotransferase [Sulfuricaulis limicola]
MRNQEGLSDYFFTKLAFNSAIIADHQMIYKVSLSKRSTIEHEFRNYEKIRSDFPDLMEFMPNYRMQRSSCVSYLSMNSYKPVSAEASLEIAQGIYKKLRSGGRATTKLEIPDTDEIQAGLKLIASIYGDSAAHRVQKIVAAFLDGGKYRIGLAHGDFHSRNILVDIHGNPRLIDLDCVRFRGIQDFDALYFVLELEWSISGTPWYETIVNYLKGDIPESARSVFERFGIEYSHGLAVSCLIDRIGQDYKKYELLLSRKYLDPIVDQVLELE